MENRYHYLGRQKSVLFISIYMSAYGNSKPPVSKKAYLLSFILKLATIKKIIIDISIINNELLYVQELVPILLVTYYIKWVTTSWTDGNNKLTSKLF